MKALYIKYKEFVLYAIFGVFTTVSNLLAFLLSTFLLGEELYLLNNAIAWITGVIVAFITNKIWVFKSKEWKLKVWTKEFAEFVSARLLSFAFEEVGMWFFVDVLAVSGFSFTVIGFTITDQMIIKLMLSIVVVILNYVFSKFVIFKKKKAE